MKLLNKTIIHYISAVWMGFLFVGTPIIMEASETDIPVQIEEDKAQNIERFVNEEDQADLETDRQETIIQIESADASHAAVEGSGRPSLRPEDGEIKDTNPSACQIISHPEVLPYVQAGSDYEVPVYTCSASLPEGVEKGIVTFTWTVDGQTVSTSEKMTSKGEQITDRFQADVLQGLTEYGVHPVYCTVSMDISSADADGTETVSTVSNQSMTVNFIVCNGINSHAVLTFSDVHEKFSNIGKALDNFMNIDDEGLIPGLIVCTGDWHNGHWMGGDTDTDNYLNTKNILISRLLSQSGGIDTVFVSGNHENGPATRDENIKAGLGVEQTYDGAGVIFDGRGQNNRSSQDIKDLIVYGINYENLQTESGLSYANVLPNLEKYLKTLRTQYAGELIVISAHAGLHVVENWGGQNSYNIDQSHEMVRLLNTYSELGMNITFLFGHDHSRREEELLLLPGEEITSTVSYALKDIDEDAACQRQTLRFSYGHSGYLTDNIGGHQRYTVIEWTDLRKPDAVITRNLYQLNTEGDALMMESLSAPVRSITSYHITGPDSPYIWDLNQSDGLIVKTDGNLEAVFTGIMVDGKEIDAQNYIVDLPASAIILKADYLSFLENGDHTLKVLFSNDTDFSSDVELYFTVRRLENNALAAPLSVYPVNRSSTPNTGVENKEWVWLTVLGVSLYGGILLRKRDRLWNNTAMKK